jgi:N-acetylglucosaminyl-diphospho-decaprenol L-rhamnosyltransferase
MSPKNNASYGVVVVSFNSGPELDTFFASLQLSTLLPAHVVVVENGPLKPDITHPKFPITVIHRPDNPGYGTAGNVGVEELPSTTPWVLISNPDVTLNPEAVSRLMDVALSSPSAGSLGPALLNPDGSIYPSARAVPGIAVGTGHALLGPVWKGNPWTKAYRGDYSSYEPRACGWLSGACLLVRRQAFDEISGFDSGYFMFMEDVDLGMRLGDAGWSNVYVPEAEAVHIVGHSTSGERALMAKAHHQSAQRFLAKRYQGAGWAPLRFVLNLGLTLRQWLVQAVRGKAS